MEQKDFILREIEKIGLLLRGILGKLMGRSENLSITIPYGFEFTNELLLDEIGFDLKYFLSLDELSIYNYLIQFKGLNLDNLELMAEMILLLSENEKPDNKEMFLKRALQLYDLCEKTDKTYSFDREAKINLIKNALQQ